ncbi:hypothetical protein E2C01_034789 [Portunus trituberculatus]|uniref:Uncharacterized protein n=1 Tax=Portunus trituberculatus TaxID=210409 RepID=A0A5B7F3R9_PORTR|nr:hypothetical protein [Portunus trituberculatus]
MVVSISQLAGVWTHDTKINCAESMNGILSVHKRNRNQTSDNMQFDLDQRAVQPSLKLLCEVQKLFPVSNDFFKQALDASQLH